VYLAEDTELKRKVALKFLPSHLSQNEGAKARFTREAQATAKLSHPNVITIHEVSEYQGRPYFAMEHIEGRSLRDVIKSKELTLDQAVNLAAQICEGLNKAHQAGVIHRDIKPSNIVIDTDGRPMLLDFGLAAVAGTDKLTKTGSTLGTVGYMSPEQASGRKTDERSDLFSLGVVLYEMITGRRPFKGEDEAATLHAVTNESPEPLARFKAEIPDGLQDVVNRALEKDAEVRYQHADGMLADLRRLRRRSDSDTAAQVPIRGRHRGLMRVLVPTALAIVVALVLILKPWRFEIGPDQPAMAAPRRLAVLYLTNLGSPDDEYLSYGITEDLTVDLTRVGTIGVAPMRSVLKYEDSEEELTEIARQLNVSHILDGSINRTGDLIRVSAQLIDVENGSNLWADRWEEAVENLPHIKEALAHGISEALEIDASIMQAAQVGTPDAENPVAYDYYLRGKYTFERKSDESDVEVALGLYRQALELEPSLLAARRGVAAVLILRGQYDQANEELLASLAGARQQNLQSDEAEALRSLARLRKLQSLWDEAQEYAEQALDISKELGDLAGEAKALTAIISLLRLRGMYNEAVALFERVFEINRQLDDQGAVAGSLRSMGNVYADQGDYEKALQNYKQALEIDTELGDRAGVAGGLINIGNISWEKGDYEEALQNCKQALEIVTELGDRDGMAKGLTNIGNIYADQGELDMALQNYKQGLEVFTQLGARLGVAKGLNNIGGIYSVQGDYEKALRNYEQALEIYTQLGNRDGIAGALNNAGIIYRRQGDHEKARQNYEQALEICTQLGDRVGMAVGLNRIGGIYSDQGHYEKALQNYEQALEICTQLGDRVGMTSVLSGLSCVYNEQGDYRKSLGYAEKTAEILLALGTPVDSAWASYTIATTIMHLGEYDRAISMLREVLTDVTRLGMAYMITGSQQDLGVAYFYKGEPEQAKENYYTALKGLEDMGERSYMDFSNGCLGELYYFLNAPDSSRKYFEQSLAIADELGTKNIQLRASGHLAALTARGGDFDGGVKQLRETLEEVKGLGNIENKVILRRLLGQVLTENGPSEADREEGRAILQKALSLATEQGYAHEIRWITELLEKRN